MNNQNRNNEKQGDYSSKSRITKAVFFKRKSLEPKSENEIYIHDFEYLVNTGMQANKSIPYTN